MRSLRLSLQLLDRRPLALFRHHLWVGPRLMVHKVIGKPISEKCRNYILSVADKQRLSYALFGLEARPTGPMVESGICPPRWAIRRRLFLSG